MAEYKDLKYVEKVAPIKSEEADKLQRALSSMGYYTTKEDGTPLSFDGAFGKYTSAAVSDFAKDYGINYTGTVSSDLYNAILTEANNRKNGTTSTTVGEQTGYNALYKNAQDYKKSAYQNALNQQSASYRAAMEARKEAEALAEIQRKRGIVDASTMAEQQKATYGANAEQVGRMGLQVSGYSDYLNSQAYASGMAARQNAKAQATEMNRQASYTEMLARLEADKEYANAISAADATYYSAISEIEKQKIVDTREEATQEKTNYMDFINSIPADATTEQIDALANLYGITDTTKIDNAKETMKTLYGENTTPEEDTSTTVDEDAVAKVFSHQEGDETVVNTKNDAESEYNQAKLKHDKGEMDEETWRVIDGTYKMEYDAIENYVSVYSQTYDPLTSWGKFASGEDQTNLLNSIRGMVEGRIMTSKGDELKEGDVIAVNVGSGKQKTYEYLENGLFKETKYNSYQRYVVPNNFVYDSYGNLKKTTGTINVYEDSPKKFGSFLGSNDPNSEQSKYLNKIIKDAKTGKITAGQLVSVNYGDLGLFTDDYVFEYIGDGKFVHVGSANVANEEDFYMPDGYSFYTSKKDGRERVTLD